MNVSVALSLISKLYNSCPCNLWGFMKYKKRLALFFFTFCMLKQTYCTFTALFNNKKRKGLTMIDKMLKNSVQKCFEVGSEVTTPFQLDMDTC